MSDAPPETEPPPAKGGQLLLRGVRVHYREWGAGPPVLLLHDLLMDHRAWRHLAPRLAERHRVIAPDLPGFGLSEKPTRYAFTREALASTACDLLAGVDAPRAHVVGHGLGGAVALTHASDHPEVVETLTVMSTVVSPVAAAFASRAPRLPVVGPFVFKQLWNRALFHAHFRRSVYATREGYDRAAVDRYYESFDSPEARECAWLALDRAVEDRSALQPRLRKVSTRSLVLWGASDARHPPSLGWEVAHQIPDARLELIANAGHSPAEEQPAEVAERLAPHLERPPPARKPSLRRRDR